MEQTLVVAEDDEMRGANTDLRHIIDLQAATLIRGRLHTSLSILQHVIELTGGDAGTGLLVDIVDQFKQTIHSLTGHSGDEDHRRIGHEAKITANVLAHAIHGLIILFDGIPLVHHDDASLACFVRHACHLGVLLGNTVLCVDHDQAHICTVDRHGRAEHTVLFNALLHLATLTHTSSVDEVILAVLIFKLRVNSIAGGTCHIADDDTLEAEDTVGEAGLTHIGAADEGDLNAVLLFLLAVIFGEILHAGIQQVTGTVAVDRRDSDGIAEAEIVELIEIGIHATHGVHLVDTEDNGLAASLQHTRHIIVCRSDTHLAVGQQDDDISVSDGDLRLLTHEAEDLVVGLGLDTAGIHQTEGAAIPVTFTVDAVTSHTGSILHDGKTLADDFVEQHGLAHIRAAHNGDNRFQISRLLCFLSVNGKNSIRLQNNIIQKFNRLRNKNMPVLQGFGRISATSFGKNEKTEGRCSSLRFMIQTIRLILRCWT